MHTVVKHGLNVLNSIAIINKTIALFRHLPEQGSFLAKNRILFLILNLDIFPLTMKNHTLFKDFKFFISFFFLANTLTDYLFFFFQKTFKMIIVKKPSQINFL